MSLEYDIYKSWLNRDGNVNTMQDILDWIEYYNTNTKVIVEKRDFPTEPESAWWFDEEGFLSHKKGSFFRIIGYQVSENQRIVSEQPLIQQEEIGYLGIICKKIDGVLNFLMQVKIEPGNINCVQISPTIQATKSNFQKKHGGKEPSYLSYFMESGKYTIVVDQIQSEQSSRFYKKRNRNIVIQVDDSIEVLPTHKWMTLGQIKELLKIDNLVNMDTRTVLSGLPLSFANMSETETGNLCTCISDKAYINSIKNPFLNTSLVKMFNIANDKKMFDEKKGHIVPIGELCRWVKTNSEITNIEDDVYKIIYCNITIEGREVNAWEQPMVEATSIGVIGLFTTLIDGARHYLVSLKQEVGCFDTVEFGPTIQCYGTNSRNELDVVENLFLDHMNSNKGIVTDVLLSEEGGRFYHEQNRNVIIEIDKDELAELPVNYYWLNLSMINTIIKFSNTLNIQLRNLISLIDIK